ncbi:hypothetical protein D9758_009439 [Tetrapyrgos nigripes]|uniref:Endo-beta-1,6-galactanase-like domain-containing protein n=1 Tax=Tetrapyrgos nigripes TaxID=182062 RepID=A0A8H5D3I8_9AGAR|nr:hypothetical protein D9758_009439 [Tetrapyrgos nigripes]
MASRTVLPALLVAAVLPYVNAATVSGTPAQTFSGIGGSGAWWTIDLFQFPEEVRQNVSSLLFSQAGLGLSSYRYNVGGGGVGVNNPSRAPETFYVSPGQYDFSKDAAGVYFLTEASKHGVSQLTMFANSAPAPLTSGGTSCGSSYVDGSGAAFGTFLADVTQHFRDQGIMINLISPMNEPDNSFSDCGQEGMSVLPWKRAEVVNGLWDALDAHGLTDSVGIIADETSWLLQAVPEYPFWLGQVTDKIAAIAHHTYDYPSDVGYLAYLAVAHGLAPGKQTWQTEVCCTGGNADGSGKSFGANYDPTIVNALLFSNMVFQSLNLAGEPHYDWWTLLSSTIGCDPSQDPACATTPNGNGWNDGIIYYDPNFKTNGNHQLYVKKQFWTYKHFGNFVKPGTQRLPITGSGSNTNMLAVSNSSTIVVLAMNTGESDSSLALNFPQTVCAQPGFRTSATEDFAGVPAATGSGSSYSLSLAALSLTSYIFRMSAC